MDIRQVLFPTDFSVSAEAAGQVAVEMARQCGATLHVVHVVPPMTDPSIAAERLSKVVQSLGGSPAVASALLSGRPAREIVAYARDKAVSLIVLGTHGRTGVSRVILGSVAEGVVRLAPCLVLTVPAAALAPRDATIPAASGATTVAAPRCLVCAGETEALICEPCRTRIRGEALERKLDAERAGRRGSPA